MKKLLAKFIPVVFFLALIPVSCGNGPDAVLNELARNRPAANQLVVDRANVFAERDKTALNRLLNDVLIKTDATIVVVTLRTLMGGQIDDFASRLYEAWGIGEKGSDRGVLILAAIEDRKIRIEVGYGLEATLTDAAAGRIIDTAVIPMFRNGNFAAGLIQGAALTARHIGYDIETTSGAAGAHETELSPFAAIMSLLVMVLFVIFAVRHPFLAMMLLGSMRGGGRFSGGGFGGGGFGGFGGGMSGGGGASRGW